MAFIDIEHGSAFRCYDILEKFFFFFLRGDIKSHGDQFDDKFLRNGLW